MTTSKKTVRSLPKSKQAKPGVASAESKFVRQKPGTPDAPNTIRFSLAGLPEENPNPVMCASEDGAVLYANRACAPLLKKWRCGKGGTLPPEWKKRVRHALAERRAVIAEEQAGNRLYQIDVVPQGANGYACLYGRDVTEQQRAEKVLRESESHYRSLFENMLNGFALCRMIFSKGKPRDFVYLAVNESFERLTGLKNVIGKKVSEVIPGIRKANPGLFEIFGRVAVTGRPEHMETWVESLKMWFSISVYCPQKEHFVAVFDVITERKQAELALQNSERRLREAQEMAHLGFWNWDVKTGEVEWSEEVFRIFGLDPKNFKPKIDSILALSPWPEDHQRDQELIQKAMENHSPGSYEQKFLRPDQSIGYYYSTFQGNYDEKGGLVSIVGTVHDITDRKKAEQELRESEDKFKYIFNHSVTGKSITFPTGEIHVNEALCKMLGYTPQELESRRWQDVTHPDDIDLTQKIIDSILSGEKKSARFVKRYLHKNGSIVWTDVGSSLRRDAGGKPLYFMTAMIDITERKRAETDLRSMNSRQAAILDAVPDIIMEVDENKVYTWANRPGMEFFGGDVIGRDAQFYFEGEQETYDKVKPIFNGAENTIYVESWQRRRDGEKRLLTWWCRVLKDDDGKVTGALSTARDVTDLRQAEAALRASEHHLRRFYESKLIGVIYWNMDGKITDANDKFLEMVGYTPDDLASGSIDWLSMTPPEYRLLDEQSVADLKATGVNRMPFEKEYIRKDGSRIPVIIAGAMLDEARFNGVAFVLDNSDRKQAEIEIQKQMNELRRWHDLTLDRETRSLELKGEVNELLVRLGEKIRYPSQENGASEDPRNKD